MDKEGLLAFEKALACRCDGGFTGIKHCEWSCLIGRLAFENRYP